MGLPPFRKSEPCNTLTPGPGAELENPRLSSFSRLKDREESGGPRAAERRSHRIPASRTASLGWDGETAGAAARAPGKRPGQAAGAPLESSAPSRDAPAGCELFATPRRSAGPGSGSNEDPGAPGPRPLPGPRPAQRPPAAHLLRVRVRGQARLQLLHNLERRLRRHRCHWRGLLAGTGLASRPRAATPPSVRPRRRRKREWSLPGLRWGACGDGLRTCPRARPRPQALRDPPDSTPAAGHAPDTPSPEPRRQPRPQALHPASPSRTSSTQSCQSCREPHPSLHLSVVSVLGSGVPSRDPWNGRREQTPVNDLTST